MAAAEMESSAGIFIYLAGVIFVISLTWKFTKFLVTFLYTYFLSKSLGLRMNIRRLGQWAVVTGCTDGIGKAYAEQLAGQGCNVVLISRSPDKLSQLASDIEKSYKVHTRVIVADFKHGDIYDNIKNDLIGLDIGILVNNVGVSYDHPEYFLEIPHLEQKVQEFFHVNMLAMTMMTNIVLPVMVTKRKGAIVNVSSFAAYKPTPLLAIYSASKAYVDCLSRCLHSEYRNRGITIQSVRPYFVTSKLSKLRRVSITVPSPAMYVRSALGVLGLEVDGPAYWPHVLMTVVADWIPDWILDKYVTFLHLGLRRRALRKREEKGE